MNKEVSIKDFGGFSSAINGLKILAILTVVLSILSVIGMFFLYTSKLDAMNAELSESKKHMFVLEPESSMMMKGTFKMMQGRDREIIYRALVNRFVDCFYDFDAETFKSNIETGINYTSNEVAKTKLADYLEGSFNLANKLRDEKMIWYAKIDSIKINMDTKEGIIWGKRKTVKPLESTMNNLIARFSIRDLDKITEKNEFGCVIDKFSIVDESVINPKNSNE
jgi:hypothetical protein